MPVACLRHGQARVDLGRYAVSFSRPTAYLGFLPSNKIHFLRQDRKSDSKASASLPHAPTPITMKLLPFFSISSSFVSISLLLMRTACSQNTFTFPRSGSRGYYNSLDTLNVSWVITPSVFNNPFLMLWVGTFPSQQLGILPMVLSTRLCTCKPLTR